MKRSTVNTLIANAEEFFGECNFRLPEWAHWNIDTWRHLDTVPAEIVDNHLGWDITDFGLGDFDAYGLLLFTIRNGGTHQSDHPKPYAEKIMIVQIGQETPFHFHWSKMEDIINRGGGTLRMQLYESDQDEGFSQEPITVSIDGMRQVLPAGTTITLEPGGSICLHQGLYHRFWAEGAPVLTGEVSSVNDDATDNRFFQTVGRFPEIAEDEPLNRLLANDYLRVFPAWGRR